MKSLLVAIVISLAIGAPVLAETDEDAEGLRLLRLHKEFLLEQEKNKVVLLDKGTDWSRYRLRSGELVVDGNYGIDLSDQKTIDRIINSVQTIRRYGQLVMSCIALNTNAFHLGWDGLRPKQRLVAEILDAIGLSIRKRLNMGGERNLFMWINDALGTFDDG